MNLTGSVTFQDNIIIGQTQSIFFISADALVSNSTFSNCIGSPIEGMGSFSYPALITTFSGTTNIINCNFSNIHYTATIYGANNANTFLTDIIIEDCSGGLFFESASLTVETCLISNINTIIFAPLYISNTSLVLSNSEFTECSSTNFGGVLFMDSESNFLMDNITFSHNSALGAGAIDISGESIGTIKDSRFYYNSATSIGGAVVLSGSSSTTFMNTEVKFCSSMSGGGIVLQESSVAYFEELILQYNSADASAGAVMLSDYGILHMSQTTISENEAKTTGGGFYISNYARLYDENSLIRFVEFILCCLNNN